MGRRAATVLAVFDGNCCLIDDWRIRGMGLAWGFAEADRSLFRRLHAAFGSDVRLESAGTVFLQPLRHRLFWRHLLWMRACLAPRS